MKAHSKNIKAPLPETPNKEQLIKNAEIMLEALEDFKQLKVKYPENVGDMEQALRDAMKEIGEHNFSHDIKNVDDLINSVAAELTVQLKRLRAMS